MKPDSTRPSSPNRSLGSRAAVALAALALAAAFSAFAAAEELTFDETTSKIAFTATKMVVGRESGEFGKFKGSIRFASGDAGASSVTVQIQMDSVTTDARGLARHLKTADFFDVDKFPTATFTSTSLTPAGDDKYVVVGTLDLHGVKKTISFHAVIRADKETLTAEAEFPLNRKDFGIVYEGAADNVIKSAVVLKLSVRAPLAAASAKKAA